MNYAEKRQRLLKIIREKAIARSSEINIFSSSGRMVDGWLLDFRNIFLDPEALEIIVDIFWEKFEKDYPFQVGGQEIAAIPLVSAIVFHSQKMGKPVNGFIIRKSRKPTGLQKIIEGSINDEKVILLDDLTHSGTAALKQIKILEFTKKNVSDFFVLVNYRGGENDSLLASKNVHLHSLFTLSEIGLDYKTEKEKPGPGFKEVWKFSSPNPKYFHRVSKSTPVLDENKLYFGTDNMCFWAINQKDGSVAWKFDGLGYPTPTGKSIFSSPAIFDKNVLFGSYDGNFYNLNKETGKLRWKYTDANAINSSPAISPDLGLVFIGLEFGLFRKKGGVVALDIRSGKKIWNYQMTNFVHSSPIYIKNKKALAIGSHDSCVYLFDAQNGKLKWKTETGGLNPASFAIHENKNQLIFGSTDNNLYALDIDSGKINGKFSARQPIYSTPLIEGDRVYFGSTDKYLYCLDLDSGKLAWKFPTGGRIFARPKIVGDKIYIGSTNGILHEIDKKNGWAISYFIATERITNEVAYDAKTETFFLPTYANEIYCLKKLES